MTIEELIVEADYDYTYKLGPCVICAQETWCGARVPIPGRPRSKRFIHLCFCNHRNPAGLRQALEKEVTDGGVLKMERGE